MTGDPRFMSEADYANWKEARDRRAHLLASDLLIARNQRPIRFWLGARLISAWLGEDLDRYREGRPL